MTSLIDLYNVAEEENIMVDCFDLEHTQSLSVMDMDGNCFIAIDPMQLESQTQERERLAHEEGHCITGSFYNIYSPYSDRRQCERKAEIWAIKKLVPKNELIEAFESGTTEVWELSDMFGVSEQFIKAALEYYEDSLLYLRTAEE